MNFPSLGIDNIRPVEFLNTTLPSVRTIFDDPGSVSRFSDMLTTDLSIAVGNGTDMTSFGYNTTFSLVETAA